MGRHHLEREPGDPCCGGGGNGGHEWNCRKLRRSVRTIAGSIADAEKPSRVTCASDEEFRAVLDRQLDRWAGVLEALRPNDGPVTP